MAENANQQQIQIRIDESRMSTVYANTIRTSTTPDEVVLDFGMNLPQQGEGGQPLLVFNVGSRIVMNWVGAKRLAASMVQIVRQYEQQFGEIQVQGRQPQPAQAPQAQPGGPRLSN